MGATPAEAAALVTSWAGACYLTPLLGAWLADARWGRYRTILRLSLVYLAGMTLLAVSASFPGVLAPVAGSGLRATFGQRALLSFALYLVALGTGGIKPNVSAFGADQFDTANNVTDRRDFDSFFGWFYLSVNVARRVPSSRPSIGSFSRPSIWSFVHPSVHSSIPPSVSPLVLSVPRALCLHPRWSSIFRRT